MNDTHDYPALLDGLLCRLPNGVDLAAYMNTHRNPYLFSLLAIEAQRLRPSTRRWDFLLKGGNRGNH